MPPSLKLQTETTNFEEALKAWQSALRNDQIKTDTTTLKNYARSTSENSTEPLAILFPESEHEIILIVKAASQSRVPLYPISCGKNWGYGDAQAPRAGQVILNLNRMNRILEVNEQFGYAVIEPGVTQGQLCNYLKTHKIKLWMDATGAGPDTSFIGNTVDRGFGHTKYGDHFHNVSGMEVVLSDGRLLKTGFGHYKQARNPYVYRYGIGPILDGLFSQSNFGIVSKLAVLLQPEPEAFCAFFLACPKKQDLVTLINLLAPLKLQGALQSAVHIANDLRSVSSRMGYPWEKMNNQTPVSDNVRAEIRSAFGIGAWNACGSISGSKEVVNALRKNIKSVLKDFKPIFLDERKLKLAEKVLNFLNKFSLATKLRNKIHLARGAFDMLRGHPVSDHLAGASWRVRNRHKLSKEALSDPLLAGAGIQWISPILPMNGNQADELVNLISPVYKKWGFDPLITFTLLTERALVCVTNIAFDKAHEDDCRKATGCYREINDLLFKEGFLPYRVGPQNFPKLLEGSTVFWDVVGQLKIALDPKNIISPGRYQPK